MNEEIQVGLGLNTTAFQEGLKKSTSDVSTFANSVKAPFSAVSGLFGGLAGIGLVAQIQSISDYAKKIRNLGEALNANTTDLQKWFNAIEYSGVSSETATKALTKFTTKLNAAADGTGKEAAAFANLGVTIKDSEGNIRPTMELLADVSDVFATMPDKSERSRMAVELFGKQGLKMVAALSMGREEMERLGSIQTVISPEALETLDKMGDDLREIFDSVKGGGTKAIVALAPLVEFWKESFNGFKAGAQLYVDYVATIFDAIATKVTTGEGTLRTALSAIGDLFTAHGNGMATDGQRKIADNQRITAIQAFVKASKEQAEFEKTKLKIQTESATVSERVSILAKQSADIEEKADEAFKHKDDSAEAGVKHRALENEAQLKAFELDKAIAAQQDEATKKRIADYTAEVDALDRINKFKQISADVEKQITEIKERGTKTTVKELAQAPLLHTDTAEQRQNKLAARQIDAIEKQQDAARKNGQFEEAAKLQKQAAELRKKLNPKAFQQQEINPLKELEDKKEQIDIEKAAEQHQREQELLLKKEAADKVIAEEKAKNKKNLGEGWDVSDAEKQRRFNIFGNAEQARQALEEATNARREAARDAGLVELDKLPESEVEARSQAAIDKQAAVIAAMAANGFQSDAENINAEFAAAQARNAAMAANGFNPESMQSAVNGVGEFDSDAIEEKIDELISRFDRPLTIKLSNGP